MYALDPMSVGVPAFLVAVIMRKPFMVRHGGDYAWEQGQQRYGVTLSLDEYTKTPKDAPLPVRVLALIQRFQFLTQFDDVTVALSPVTQQFKLPDQPFLFFLYVHNTVLRSVFLIHILICQE